MKDFVEEWIKVMWNLLTITNTTIGHAALQLHVRLTKTLMHFFFGF